VITPAITGLGGVGKSQLAARYVQQCVDGYDVAAWIRAEDRGTADLAQLAAKLGQHIDGLSPSEAAQLALDTLNDNHPPANCLTATRGVLRTDCGFDLEDLHPGREQGAPLAPRT
jgi:hypothetical protein